jgi:hypothetical protein
MSSPFFMMRNKHTPTGSEPPAITNEVGGQYLGYFENRRGIGLLGFLGRPASESGILCRD